jgi:hypothetical protein
MTRVLPALSCFVLVLAIGVLGPEPGHPNRLAKMASNKQRFDLDSWNRLDRLFYDRTSADAKLHVHTGADAPFGSEAKSVVRDPDAAIWLLDEFLKSDFERQFADPLERAMFHRDLWYAFDMLARPPDPDSENDAAVRSEYLKRRPILKRLALLLKRVEQPATVLASLPDNYKKTVELKIYPARFDVQHPEQPYLPNDLRLDGTADWVLIGSQSGRLAAPEHARFVEGKSLFVPMLRLPGGRKATETFLAAMPAELGIPMSPKFRQFPDGTQVALVRRMLLPDQNETLQLTPVIESIQLRVFSKGNQMHSFEFTLDRPESFAARGGLRTLAHDDVAHFGFGIEPIDRTDAGKPKPILASCKACHGQEKLFSVNTFGFRTLLGYQGASQADLGTQIRLTKELKKSSYAWGLLVGLRDSSLP